jgi:hypothetical protein
MASISRLNLFLSTSSDERRGLRIGAEPPVWKGLEQRVAKNLCDGGRGFPLITSCDVGGANFVGSEGHWPSQ